MTIIKFLTLISFLLISPLTFSESQDKNYQARLQDVMKARKLMDKKRERDEIKDLAQDLAHEILIIDTHLDTPIQLYMQQDKNGSYEDITKASSLHFDYDRAVSGGLNVPFLLFSLRHPQKKKVQLLKWLKNLLRFLKILWKKILPNLDW